jgi:hypothetical protein
LMVQVYFFLKMILMESICVLWWDCQWFSLVVLCLNFISFY